MIKLLVAVAFLALNAYVYHFMARSPEIPERESFVSFPLGIGDWECRQNEPLDPKVLANLGATDTLVCNYRHETLPAVIGLYVGYHATQIREEGGGAGENSIHPPAHCLPGSGWDIIDSRTVALPIDGFPDGRAKRLVIAKGKARQLVYYWYQMQGQAIAEDWRKILQVGYSRATQGRTDGALVRFTTMLDARDEGEAEERLIDFANLVTPKLPRFVPD